MSDEEFRRFLIYILNNYKIYYQDISGKYQEYIQLEKLCKEMDEVISKIDKITQREKNDNYKYINTYGKDDFYNIEIPNINYKSMLFEETKKLKGLLNAKVLKIKDHYSLDDIAEELSKIGDYEEFDYIYENSKLSELKGIMNKDSKVRLKYIKDNSNKKIG